MTSQEFRMARYGQKPPFASFLPGIAGVKGIPIWCYYVNRGQGVVSFGVDNKDHAIMEFLPAHRAYAEAGRRGFRTFLRLDGRCVELFSDESEMAVGMNTLGIREENRENGLAASVDYFVLPEERLGALVRRVRITNTGTAARRLEVLDGMPELIPYGVGDVGLKNILQTTKAWMQVEDVEKRVPYYRVRVSLGDTAQVGVVEGGNFALGFDESGALLPVTADMEAVFGYDTSLTDPLVFRREGLSGVLGRKQNASNLFPGAFFALERELAPGESLAFNEVIGQVERHGLLDSFLAGRRDGAWFDAKYRRAQALTEELCACAETRTADPTFDAYCQYTYMDNVLRGGQPIRLGTDKVFYVYSRKHGDLERDYNWFSMLPEFFSQGNGNFRDVNQNRRSDTFFSPFVGRENIHTFYRLIQLDGCNPLSVEQKTYTLEEPEAALAGLDGETRAALLPLLSGPFTPGKLYGALLDRLDGDAARKHFDAVMAAARGSLNARFGEGYWSDHWTYNLDLVEEYLAVFPEKERELLYTPEYTWFLSQVLIAPRARRYAETENGLRQYHALDESTRRTTPELYLRDARGREVRSTLIEKLALLCAAKFANLDPYGMGVEMEGGKPGWYDALNGLPGLFGSSMCETYELKRMLDYTAAALGRHPGQVELLAEVAGLLTALDRVNSGHREELESRDEVLSFWNDVNDVKEAYRAGTYAGVSGERRTFASAELARILSGFAATVELGIQKALRFGAAEGGLCPAYFSYRVPEYSRDEDGIHPLRFEVVPVPAFLEGPVRRLKLAIPTEEKRDLYRQVKASPLYDRKLSMYRVNASLQNASYELGRCRAFTPGWLENGSIWLHMEYKYLLELLRSGLYEEFFADFRAAAVPFLDPEVYGRSPLENSSFLVSSANPNEAIHGRGFVARLSGSTAELLSIWRRMFFGETPFTVEDGELACRLTPAIPDYLIGEDRTVRAMFLGRVPVTYHLADRAPYIPGNYRVERIRAVDDDGAAAVIDGGVLRGPVAHGVRDGGISALEISLAR